LTKIKVMSITRDKGKSSKKKKKKDNVEIKSNITTVTSKSDASNNKQTVSITINNPNATTPSITSTTQTDIEKAGEELKLAFKEFNDLLQKAEALKIAVPDAIKKITMDKGDVDTVDKIKKLVIELKSRSAKLTQMLGATSLASNRTPGVLGSSVTAGVPQQAGSFPTNAYSSDFVAQPMSYYSPAQGALTSNYQTELAARLAAERAARIAAQQHPALTDNAINSQLDQLAAAAAQGATTQGMLTPAGHSDAYIPPETTLTQLELEAKAQAEAQAKAQAEAQAAAAAAQPGNTTAAQAGNTTEVGDTVISLQDPELSEAFRANIIGSQEIVKEIIAKHSGSAEDLEDAYADHVNNFENYTKTLTNPKEIAVGAQVLNAYEKILKQLGPEEEIDGDASSVTVVDVVGVKAPSYPLYPNEQAENYPQLLLQFKKDVRGFRHDMFNFMLSNNWKNMSETEKQFYLMQMNIASKDLNENAIRDVDYQFLNKKNQAQLRLILISLDSPKYVGTGYTAKDKQINQILKLLLEKKATDDVTLQPMII
jgi:hypothetical protein